MSKSKRLEILEASLAKKEKLLDEKIQDHFDAVKSANGQPLNDKRNGHVTLNKWERQNESIKSIVESINVTKSEIEREKSKINRVNDTYDELPDAIKKRIDSGELIQWRKHPTTFFVDGVDKARIVYQKGKLFTRYARQCADKQQFEKFKDVAVAIDSDIKASEF